MQLFEDAALDLKSAADVKRTTIEQRVNKAKEIVMESRDDHFII